MSRPVNTVVIVGGGTAGWLTAGLLAAEHRGEVEVVLVESPDVKPIGVGEGTWPTMRLTLEKIGVSETDFVRECDASFKQGTRFRGWLDGGDEHYDHPFTPPAGFHEITLGPHWWPYRQRVSFADAVAPQGRAIDQGLAPKQIATPEFASVLNYGYHLDAGKFSGFLERHCTGQLAVRHIRDNVTSIRRTECGDIASLETESGRSIAADLFVDCTGLKALLLGEELGIPFIPQSSVLFNDRALAVQVPRQDATEAIASVTLSTARSAGWIWDIGLPPRRGVGYTYSSSHIEDVAAEAELRTYLAGITAKEFADACDLRLIRFSPGHREKLWHRNCVAIGLSGGFVEPLEASALVMIELSAKMLSEHLPPDRDTMEVASKRFNNKFGYHWERIIEFLKLHYVLSRRTDSDYWRENREPASVPERLRESLHVWQYESPWREDLPQFDELFSAASYQYVLYGMQFETMEPRDGRRSFESGKTSAENLFRENERSARQVLNLLPTNRDLIGKVHEHGFQKI